MCLYRDDSCLIINYEMVNAIHELRSADTLAPTSLERRCLLAQLIADILPIYVLSTVTPWTYSYFLRRRPCIQLGAPSLYQLVYYSFVTCSPSTIDIKSPLVSHQDIPSQYSQSISQRHQMFPTFTAPHKSAENHTQMTHGIWHSSDIYRRIYRTELVRRVTTTHVLEKSIYSFSSPLNRVIHSPYPPHPIDPR